MKAHSLSDHGYLLGSASALLVFAVLVAVLATGCSKGMAGSDSTEADTETRIANAMSAAPLSIAADAIIMDWPAGPGESMTVLREGTNDWICLPDQPPTPGNDPMCIDAPWLDFIGAMGSRQAPVITRMGFGYMLQANDSPYSNTDPFATGPAPDNEWQETDVPHLMILVPTNAHDMLTGLPTDPDTGGPWVMFHGTPFVHIMAPMPLYVPETN